MDEQQLSLWVHPLKETVAYLAQEAKLAPGSLLVVGGSTSEVLGGHIGKFSSPQVGNVLAAALAEACGAHDLVLAVQCCEHLNRALVMDRREASQRGYTVVSAVPFPKAGGSLGSAYYRLLGEPVLVAHVAADGGIDIGDTLIGMHLRHVAVPLRGPHRTLGGANLVLAYARPPLIGGERTRYSLEEA